jgi:fumarate reductase subunit C
LLYKFPFTQGKNDGFESRSRHKHKTLGAIQEHTQNITVTTTKYRFNTLRLITLWFLPLFFTALIMVLLYLKVGKSSGLKFLDFIIWALLFVFTVGLFLYLFLNHLPFARHTELAITRQGSIVNEIKITLGDIIYTTDYADIKEVIEYSTAKLPWSSIIKWEIITKDNQIIISSLTISKYNFERIFWNKIKEKTHLFPKI